jgi:hypothetical protein
MPYRRENINNILRPRLIRPHTENLLPQNVVREPNVADFMLWI